MRLLLDTHALIWSCFDRQKLSPTVKAILNDTSNDLFFSSASIWEMAIKCGIKKLYIPGGIPNMILDLGSELSANAMPVNMSHAAAVEHLPHYHSDPFDRILVAQCLTNDMVIVSIDDKLDPYGVERLW